MVSANPIRAIKWLGLIGLIETWYCGYPESQVYYYHLVGNLSRI